MDKFIEILKSPMKLGAYAILAVMAWGLFEYGAKVFNGGKEVFNLGVAFAKQQNRIESLENRVGNLETLNKIQYGHLINIQNSLCWLTIEAAKSDETKKKVCAGTQIKP